MSLADVVRAVDAACRRTGSRWYLFGAQAAMLRGVVRTTEDVDLTVDLARATTAELVDALSREGLALRVSDADEFIAATRVLPLRHEPTGTPVDVVLAGSFVEDRFFDRLEVVEIDGVLVNLPALEDLVVMKILASRPKDLDDVLAMLVANPTRDDAQIRETLGTIEQAVDSSDLVSAYDAVAKRAQRVLRNRR